MLEEVMLSVVLAIVSLSMLVSIRRHIKSRCISEVDIERSQSINVVTDAR